MLVQGDATVVEQPSPERRAEVFTNAARYFGPTRAVASGSGGCASMGRSGCRSTWWYSGSWCGPTSAAWARRGRSARRRPVIRPRSAHRATARRRASTRPTSPNAYAARSTRCSPTAAPTATRWSSPSSWGQWARTASSCARRRRCPRAGGAPVCSDIPIAAARRPRHPLAHRLVRERALRPAHAGGLPRAAEQDAPAAAQRPARQARRSPGAAGREDSIVGLLVTLHSKERPPAPPGKDADPQESPWGFQGSRTPPGGDRRSPISGGTLREGPLVHGRSRGSQRGTAARYAS